MTYSRSVRTVRVPTLRRTATENPKPPYVCELIIYFYRISDSMQLRGICSLRMSSRKDDCPHVCPISYKETYLVMCTATECRAKRGRILLQWKKKVQKLGRRVYVLPGSPEKLTSSHPPCMPSTLRARATNS